MKPSKQFQLGLRQGFLAPFGVWREISRSMTIDLTPRYRNTVADAWSHTGMLLRWAEQQEGKRLEQTSDAKTERTGKEGSRGKPRIST